MRRKFNYVAVMALSSVMSLSPVMVVPVTAAQSSVVIDSTKASKVDWKYSDNGKTLTFSGGGAVDKDLGYSIKNVTKIVVKDGITDIGCAAFKDCTSLKSVDLASSVKNIAANAFFNCSSLEDIVIPNGVTKINSGVFKHCKNLKKINIPDGVTVVGTNAFSNTGLTSISIPASVTVVDASAFLDCKNLGTIKVAKNNKIYDSRDNCNAIILISNNELKVGANNTKIPNTVCSIGSKAFRGRTGLKTVTIPSSVKSINASAFENCTGLTSVTAKKGLESIGFDAFRGCSALNSVSFQSGVKKIYKSAFVGCSNLKKFNIPNGVATIEDDTFRDCVRLESITIPASVKYVNPYAFSHCNSLKTIKINKNNKVYNSTDNLNALIIKNNLTLGCSKTDLKLVPKGTKTNADAFKVVFEPKATILKGVNNSKASTMVVSWDKNEFATGYEVEYSVYNNFKNSKKFTVTGSNSINKTITGLTKGKTYNVRVRSYRVVDSKKYYSSWSALKKVTIAK